MGILMHLLLFASFFDIFLTQNVTVLSGHLGDTLTILCPYKHYSDRWKKKTWCKEVSDSQCQPVISARRFWLQLSKRSNGSTTISDNVHESIVTVTINKLQHDDTGIYQCQANSYDTVNILKTVQVQVWEEPILGNISEVAKVQYSVSGPFSWNAVSWILIILGCSFVLFKVIFLSFAFTWLTHRNK
ncbi:hypothetical protein GDO86_003384, partial [Hymenochirus boettgeri]